MAALRKLAEKCKFGEFLDQELRDKLVCGIWNETIQRKLLTEKELIAARAYELARGMEAAYQQSTQLQTAQQEQKPYKVTSPVEPKSTGGVGSWDTWLISVSSSQSNVGGVEKLAT